MMTRVGTTLFFLADDGIHGQELWKSDGTQEGTVLVKDFLPGRLGGSVKAMASAGARLFLVRSADSGLELWTSDGTGDGTSLVRDFQPGAGISNPTSLTEVGAALFFAADDGVHGPELWKSDGTREGTVLVKDLRPGPHGAGLRDLKNVGGRLFFVADDGVHGAEPWTSDGTEGGTLLVKDIHPGERASAPVSLVAADGTLFFWADDGVHGAEPWTSDGTAAGTVLVRDVEVRPASSAPGDLTRVGETVFFRARTETHGEELWKTDGTAAGTTLVKDLNPGRGGSIPSDLRNVGGTLFFLADDGVRGMRLWKSDGTEAGTVLLQDLLPHGPFAHYGPLGAMNGELYFVLNDALWRSDGTRAGTTFVKSIAPGGVNDSTPNFLGVLDGKLLFPVSRYASTGSWMELWGSDGTEAGTTVIKNLGVLPSHTSTAGVPLGGSLLFLGPAGQLWKTDGTEAGSVLLKNVGAGADWDLRDMVRVGDRVVFSARPTYLYGQQPQLWVSDGTEAGTVLLGSFDGVRDLVELGGRVFFLTARELWSSDGTVEGTGLVMKGSIASLGITRLSRAGNLLLLATHNPDPGGHRLWLGDGTAAGTFPVEDHASSFSSDSGVVLGGQLLLSGADPEHGQELWTVPLPDVFFLCPGPYTAEATSAMGASVAFSPVWVDEAHEPRPSVRYSHEPGAVFPLGVTQVSAVAGPGASCTFPITVKDTTAPVVTCPAEQTVQAAQASGAGVEYPAATVHDAVSTPEVTYSTPSGSTFPVGTTLVTVSARDAAGNSATCGFHVQVTAPGNVQPPEEPSAQGPSSSMGCGATAQGALAWQVLTLVALLGRRSPRRRPRGGPPSGQARG
ncbi:ELWxxDGT repeat protein [Archangium gephyra]|uniref:ELWxxDGT repeat protein n=1 Tax=Archangium gephyra TaxID=48 RepID=UPI003B78FA4C